MNTVGKKITEAALDYIWPWIKEQVWPIIQTKILEEIAVSFPWFIQKIKDIFSQNSKEREHEARENAQAAEEKTKKTSDEVEIAELKKEAEIWRKVAEQYKKDLEDIKSKVTEVETEALEEIKEEVLKNDPDINFDNGSATLSIGGSNISLPQLEQS
ncbi:MAG: hypothetical protein ACXVZU_03390 [Methanobacteriaceae archaeon]